MKRIVFLLSVALLLCSCSSTYYYATISKAYNEDKVVQEPYGDYFVRKDSFDIAYSFNGWGGPVKLAILNKGNQPLFIDWSKSALIINGMSYPYVRDYGDISASIDGGTISVPAGDGVRLGGFGGAIRGSVRIPKNATFVPPGVWESPPPLMIDNPDFTRFSKHDFVKTELNNKNGKSYSAKEIDYTENHTPIRLAVYLTIYNDKGESQYVESKFYLSNLKKVNGLSPQNLPHEQAHRGDLYYLAQMDNRNYYWIAGGFLAACGLIAWGIDAAMDMEHKDPDWWTGP